jgi:DNA excision repair protein ERCC-1
MSSHNNPNQQTSSRPTVVVNNPYVKKRKQQQQQQQQQPYGETTTATSDPSSSFLPTIQPATFSQAFAFEGEQGDSTLFHQSNDNNNSANYINQPQDNTTTTTNDTNDIRVNHLQLQPHVLGVSNRQKGNGLLKYIRNVPIQYLNIVPDYIMNTTTCGLFLSVKYHQLYPQYVYRRIAELGQHNFKLRILLVLVDVDDCANALLVLNKIGVTNSFTVVLAWSELEAARYLETYKVMDGKDASMIQKRESTNVVDQMADFITACKPCSKTDASTVWSHFGTVSTVVQATKDELALCPGLGPVKVQRLYDAFHKPFSKRVTKQRRRQQQQQQREQEEKKQREEEKLNIEETKDNDKQNDDDGDDHQVETNERR